MTKLSIELSENNVGCYVKTNLKNITHEEIQEIKKLLNKHSVLFFKEQHLNPQEYIRFASNFGKPAEYPMLKPHKDFKDIYVIERKKSDKGIGFGIGAHTDSSYMNNPPRFTFLQAIQVPEEGKGNTLFYNHDDTSNDSGKIHFKLTTNFTSDVSGQIIITRNSSNHDTSLEHFVDIVTHDTHSTQPNVISFVPTEGGSYNARYYSHSQLSEPQSDPSFNMLLGNFTFHKITYPTSQFVSLLHPVTFRVLLNASYLGEFYLPITYCESMYDNEYFSRKAGGKVKVINAGDDLSEN